MLNRNSVDLSVGSRRNHALSGHRSMPRPMDKEAAKRVIQELQKKHVSQVIHNGDKDVNVQGEQKGAEEGEASTVPVTLESDTKNLKHSFHLGASDTGDKIFLSGFLIKRGGKRKNWKRRWFVLLDGYINYYKNKEVKSLLIAVLIVSLQVNLPLNHLIFSGENSCWGHPVRANFCSGDRNTDEQVSNTFRPSYF